MAEFSVKGEWDLKPQPPKPDTPCECCGRLKDALRARCFGCQIHANRHETCTEHCSSLRCQNPPELDGMCWIHAVREQERVARRVEARKKGKR